MLSSQPEATPEPSLDQPLRISSRLRARSALGFLVALGILVFFVSRLELDLPRTWEIIRSAQPALFLVAFIAYYCTFPLRAVRWRLLLQSARITVGRLPIPPLPSLSGIIYLSWFINCLVPAKLGDAYRGYQIKRRTGASFSAAMGTVVAERAFDTVVLAVLLLASLLFIGRLDGPESDAAERIVWATVALLVLCGVGVSAMWLLRSHLPRLLPARLQEAYQRFQDGTLGSFRRAPAGGLVTLAVWSTEAARMYFVMESLSLGLSFPHAVFLSLANALLTVVPFTPGGLGLVEAGMVGLLMLAGVPKEQAAATAVLDRIISYWSIVGFGSLLFLIRRRI
jgi:hypothetical protein